MKTNKLAAGALALALGLGAVTPAFAEDAAKPSNSGQGLVTKDYRTAEENYVKAFEAKVAADAKEAELQKVYDEKKAALDEADKAIEDYDEKVDEFDKEIAKIEAEAERVLGDFDKAGGTVNEAGALKINNEVADNLKAAQAASRNDYRALLHRKAEKEAEKVAYINGYARLDALQTARDRAAEEYHKASQNLSAQQEVVKEANKAYADAKDPFIEAGVDKTKIDLAEKTGDITYVTEGKTDDSEGKDSDTDEEETSQLEKVQAALYESRVIRQSAEYLIENVPALIKDIESDLNKLLKEQEEIIAKLEAAEKQLMGKKIALADILFTTAYADEGEMSKEEIDDVINDAYENKHAIEDLLEKADVKAAEAQPSDGDDGKDEGKTPDPDDGKDDGQPSDGDDGKDDGQPSDGDDGKDDGQPSDGKDDGQPSDGKDDGKTADTKETKTEVKTVKKPAKNAKTGVVGVAGVAGVLAAASVAYAASKKNN